MSPWMSVQCCARRSCTLSVAYHRRDATAVPEKRLKFLTDPITDSACHALRSAGDMPCRPSERGRPAMLNRRRVRRELYWHAGRSWRQRRPCCRRGRGERRRDRWWLRARCRQLRGQCHQRHRCVRACWCCEHGSCRFGCASHATGGPLARQLVASGRQLCVSGAALCGGLSLL